MLRISIILLLSSFFLFSQERDNIIFPHQFHIEDMELECNNCHEGVNESTSLELRILPEMEICLNCHDGDTATDECSVCHTNSDDPQSHKSIQLRSGPDFSHKLHLTKQLDCFYCHTNIESDDEYLPYVSWKEKDCSECHKKNRPENHTLEWDKVHGIRINQIALKSCNLCHSQASCDGCHQLQQFEPKVHPLEWMLMHGFETKSGTTDCTTCHNIRNDCRTCHRQNGVMPMNHNLPGWVESMFSYTDGGLHTSAALDAPEVCQACHEPAVDQTCQRCHGE